MSQGSQPCQGDICVSARPGDRAAAATANSGSGAGCQACRNRNVTTSEPSEDSTSVSV